MKPPVLAAEIERRLLINYRADPEVVRPMLPPRLRPHLVDGSAVVGICLIRLGAVRPARWPRAVGLHSENAAHRIAVEWDGPRGRPTGVYIPRRDSDARMNALVGGRLYPGVHHLAAFDVEETEREFHVAFRARDRSLDVTVDAELTDDLGGRLFADVSQASDFFRAGVIGWSPGRTALLEGLELKTDQWMVAPVRVVRAVSSFFDDPIRFPRGTVQLDCGLLMRNVSVTWNAVEWPRWQTRTMSTAY